MHDETDHADGTPNTRRHGPGLLWQFLPLILGFVAFELTANSMLGIAVACMKFGWEDFITAIWLVRHDRRRMRGIACGGFQAALGFIKACVAGLAMVFAVLVLIEALQGGRRFAPLEEQIVAALFTILGSGAAFVLLLGLGITVALFGRVHVWIGPESHRSRRCKQWPPRSIPTPHRAANEAAALLTGACLLGGFVGGFAVWCSTLIVFVAPDLPSTPLFVLALLILSLVGTFRIVIRLVQWIGSRVIAPTPLDCWPEAPRPG